MSSLQTLLNKQFPCPGCGASLEFNPAVGQMKCPYCGQESAMPQIDTQVEERSFDAFVHTNQTQIAALSTTAVEVECPGCRAQLTFQPPDVADRCPFCNTAIVAQPHSPSPVIAPEAVLPFSISQKQARDRIFQWIKSRWFAPSGLKQMAQHEKIQGVYLPFWTYDCQTDSTYSGSRGTHYYVTETYTDTNEKGETVTKTRQVQHTRWTPTSGRVSRFFDDVLIPAVQSVNVQRLEQLEPWNLAKLVPYDPSYLAGFKAQRYQVQMEQGFETAKAKMARRIHTDVERDIGGDEQRVSHISTDHSSITFKHVLLPIWIASYRYQSKQYQVMVNAQTGEVLGDRPYSVWKITAAILAGLATIGAIFGGYKLYENYRSPTPPAPSTSQPSAKSPTEDYLEALRLGNEAAILTQTAQTQSEWQQVSDRWHRSIDHLQAVPSSSEAYAAAQQKLRQYQTNLSYAEQRAASAAP